MQKQNPPVPSLFLDLKIKLFIIKRRKKSVGFHDEDSSTAKVNQDQELSSNTPAAATRNQMKRQYCKVSLVQLSPTAAERASSASRKIHDEVQCRISVPATNRRRQYPWKNDSVINSASSLGERGRKICKTSLSGIPGHVGMTRDMEGITEVTEMRRRYMDARKIRSKSAEETTSSLIPPKNQIVMKDVIQGEVSVLVLEDVVDETFSVPDKITPKLKG